MKLSNSADSWLTGIVLAVGLAAGAGNLMAAPHVQSSQVIQAIRRGVSYLLNNESSHNAWDRLGPYRTWGVPPWAKVSGFRGGPSSVVTEALIDVNQSLHLRSLNLYGPKMQTALKYLENVPPSSTYGASFQANVFALLPSKALYRRVLYRDAQYLLRTMHRGGAYTYYPPIRQRVFDNQTHKWTIQSACLNLAGYWDNSNSQYGVLGMWACAHSGMEVPFSYWQRVWRHWRICQYVNGTWGYGGFHGRPTRPTPGRPTQFTPAGLASLFICDEFIDARRTAIRAAPDTAIVSGLHWMNHNFNPRETDLYAMYGDERVALASGIKTFGGHDWYRDFASTLLNAQNGDGSWGARMKNLNWHFGQQGQNDGDHPFVGTAYALLILDRGLNPVFMNKLHYGPSGAAHFYGQWNARQRDLANVTSWISRTYEVPLNWQVVNIHTPVSEWLDSPILYINGYKDPKFTKNQVAKIREFVDDGGMVFCNCNGNSQRFQRAMIQYGQRVVNHAYEAQKLPKDSLLYHMLPGYKFTRDPGLIAISNGIRDVWIISPQDLGATWQRREFSRRAAWNIPASLYLYATGKGYLANRLKSLYIGGGSGPAQRSVGFAQIHYAGNWNPEPGAWPRMAKLAASQFQTSLSISNVAIAKLDARSTPLAHLTGTGGFTLSTSQIAALRKYIAAGGMIVADSGGGHQKFTDAFDRLVAKILPHADFVDLPANASIIRGSMPGGVNVSQVKYRKFYVDSHRRRTTPDLQGVKIHGRWVIVFSPWDITSGLLGTKTWGIDGYSPDSAQALARNIICYAAAHAN